MVRSRRTRIPAEEKTRLVLAVLANETTCAEAGARRQWPYFLASTKGRRTTCSLTRCVTDAQADGE
jgi:hypothetical protein